MIYGVVGVFNNVIFSKSDNSEAKNKKECLYSKMIEAVDDVVIIR